jgi:hypothetical protein
MVSDQYYLAKKLNELPFPMTHTLILLAQYSLLHHSTNRRRVSRPTVPPSASDSLDVDATDGEGDAPRDGMGDGPRLVIGDGPEPFSFRLPLPFSLPLAFRSLPALDKLSLFPLPNLFQT